MEKKDKSGMGNEQDAGEERSRVEGRVRCCRGEETSGNEDEDTVKEMQDKNE